MYFKKENHKIYIYSWYEHSNLLVYPINLSSKQNNKTRRSYDLSTANLGIPFFKSTFYLKTRLYFVVSVNQTLGCLRQTPTSQVSGWTRLFCSHKIWLNDLLEKCFYKNYIMNSIYEIFYVLHTSLIDRYLFNLYFRFLFWSNM